MEFRLKPMLDRCLAPGADCPQTPGFEGEAERMIERVGTALLIVLVLGLSLLLAWEEVQLCIYVTRLHTELLSRHAVEEP